ncbi:hypothetical protein VB776_06745 [Arcicella sp. DC2W]|uniref:Uncharacterized protein n=1 Tax=Arcicella gelida TaxID=2984195 RepID=A0ABU5S2A1_9BACT|nr:hypothetical protein [Arcicella sp. DC2W]MEA5402604.1 hypothetical protein [Arcicella sp. DC2W]
MKAHDKEFIKNFDAKNLAKLDNVSQENYKILKDDTDNFTDFSIFDVVPDAEATLESWVKTVKATIKEVEKPVVVSPNSKASRPSVQKAQKPAKQETKSNESKPSKVIKTKAPKQSQLEKNEILKEQLREENKELIAKVKQNSKFKDKLSKELSEYLQKNQMGLGAKSDDAELKQLRAKNKFYKNLLAGDKADFKAIARRVGYDYAISKPRPKKSKGLSGARKVKSFTDKIVDFFSL